MITVATDLVWPFRNLNLNNVGKNVKNYLLILPIALLVTFSQLIVKWRSNTDEAVAGLTYSQHLMKYLLDPVILSAYAAALFASFAWLYVVTRLPLMVAFPVYIGITFVMVLFGGWFFLAEAMSATKLVAVFLILCGIALGMSADA
jgi:multidrug transporter EmrE-like cation transporter